MQRRKHQNHRRKSLRKPEKAPEEPLEGEKTEEKETNTEAERLNKFNDYYEGKEVKGNE